MEMMLSNAVGDGITDDTAAIQQAINRIPARGGTLLFPAGTYRITSQIDVGNGTGNSASIQNNIRLLGVGGTSGGCYPENNEAAAVTLLYDGPADDSVMYVHGPFNGFSLERFRIVTGRAGCGLQLQWIRHSALRDVAVVGSEGDYLRYGILLGVPIGATRGWPGASSNHFEQLTIATEKCPNAQGLVLNGQPNVNIDPHRNSFVNMIIQYHGSEESAGIVLAFTDSNTFYECDVICGNQERLGPGLALDCCKVQVGGVFPLAFPLNNAFYNCSVGKVVHWGDQKLFPRAAFFFPATTMDGESYDDAKGLVFGWKDSDIPPLRA